MIRWLRILLPLLVLAIVAGMAPGQDLLSRPEVPGYETPTNVFPKPRADYLEYLDVALLAAALGLASYLALVKRSRRGLFLLTILSLAWFGFWREGCICSVGSIQNVALGIFDRSNLRLLDEEIASEESALAASEVEAEREGYPPARTRAVIERCRDLAARIAPTMSPEHRKPFTDELDRLDTRLEQLEQEKNVPEGARRKVYFQARDLVRKILYRDAYTVPVCVLAFFSLPLVFTLFFGRTFCAAVCPLGAVQELVAVRPVKVPAWLDHALGLLPYVYLGVAVLFAATGTAFVICEYDPFVGFFRLSGSANMLILGGSFLVIGLFVGRPYCRYLCPYGALLGLASRVSKWHVRIPPDECIKCRLCEDACPYGAIREPTVDQSIRERSWGRWRLALLLVLLPGLVGAGAWLGNWSGEPMSRLHPVIRLAEQVRLEERGQVEETTEASDAFRNTGRPVTDLYRQAIDLRGRFAFAGGWLGAFLGLVVGIKLIHLAVRRRRVDYQPDRANCVACGRCFWYCPPEQVRLGLIENLPTHGKLPERPVR